MLPDTRRGKQRRAGFSLVELLVVISIIAILMSLVLAGVFKASDAAQRADTTSRLAAISNGIGTFKSQFNATYIPAGQVDIDPSSKTFRQVIGPFRLMSQYPAVSSGSTPNTLNVNCFEAQYIASLFPQASPSNGFGGSFGSGTTAVQLNANQTLLFFLNGITQVNSGSVTFLGFSKNPSQPFASPNSVTDDRKGPFLDLSNKHYNIASAPGGGSFPQLIDGWKNPIAYFVSYNGKANLYGGWNQSWNGTTWTPYPGNPQPYTVGNANVNPSGFQLISAGKDGQFGPGGSWSSISGGVGEDDRANFSTNNLGAGPQ